MAQEVLGIEVSSRKDITNIYEARSLLADADTANDDVIAIIHEHFPRGSFSASGFSTTRNSAQSQMKLLEALIARADSPYEVVAALLMNLGLKTSAQRSAMFYAYSGQYPHIVYAIEQWANDLYQREVEQLDPALRVMPRAWLEKAIGL